MRLTRIAERPLSVFLIIVISLSFGLPRIIPAANSPMLVADPVSAVRDQIRSMASSLDSSRAMSMAEASAQFRSSIQGLNFTFNSIFNTWSYTFGPRGPVVVWKDVNVVYSHQFANGTFENIVVTEDPHLTQVLGVNTQMNAPGLGHVTAGTGLATTTASLSPSASPASPVPSASLAARGGSPVLITQSSPTSPDFTLSSSAPSLTIIAGNSANALMTLTSVNGFVGSIALEYSVTPANTQHAPSFGLSVNSITLLSSASGTSNLSVITTPFPNTNTGTYNVNVTAVSGTLVHSVFVTVNVQASIQLTVGTPSPSSFIAGNSATSSITVTSVGVTGSVSLTASVSPSNGPGTNFSPGSVSITPGSQAGSTLTITTTSSTPSNSYTITVYANDPDGMNANAQVSVVVQPDFQISPTTPVYIGNGQSGSSTINLQSYGFTGSVSLTASSPSGITTSFGTNPVSLGSGGSGGSQMTISVPSSVSSGDNTISVTGSSGSISHTAYVDVSVCDSTSENTNYVAGYLFTLNCSGNRLVLGAKSSWTVPSVSEPSSYHCYNQDCDVTVSSALTDGSGSLSSSGAVFAGSFSVQHCGLAGCDSPSYHAFYDYLPNNSVLCTNSVNSGDSITGEVTNNYYNPNQASTAYFATITDVTKGTSCSSGLQNSSMGSPIRAQFSVARPNTRLPRFSTVTITSCQLGFPGGYSSCASAYNAGLYDVGTMVNSGTTNVAVGTVGSDSSFTLTWKDSNGA